MSMSQELIALILQIALQYGIPAAQAIVNIIHNPAPTQADWDKVWVLAAKPL